MERGKKQERHFVLVHDLCHGAWCWYRVASTLRSSGHRVTAPDLASSGASPMRVHEVALAAVPPGEKVVLVGHSYGGHSLALVMQAHPDKIAVAVFISAAMPVAGSPMSLSLEQIMEENATDCVTDSVSGISGGGGPDNPVETFLLDPRCLSQRLYQRSPPEDLELAAMLVRPGQWFLGDATMKDDRILTEELYGAVRRVCVVTEEDETWAAESQRRMASRWSPGSEVVAIDGADHMAMCSKPRELSDLLVEIANKYN